MLKTFQKLKVFQHKIQHARNLTNLVNIAVDNQGIATVTMQRKPVNSMNYEFLTDLHAAFEQVENDNAKGMILTSALDTVFSAGLDIQELYKPDEERFRKFWTSLQDMWAKLYSLSTPTLALINGHAIAGGCLLAISCEYRIMVPDKIIGLNETQVGVIVPKWLIAAMRNAIPERHAELAITSGRLFKTDEAQRIGLIDELVANKEEGMKRSLIFFKRFDKVNPIARQMTKMACRRKDLQVLFDNKDEDLESFYKIFIRPEVQQGLGVYLKNLKNK